MLALTPSVQSPRAYDIANLTAAVLGARLAAGANATMRGNLRTAQQDSGYRQRIHPDETTSGLVEADLTFGYDVGNLRRYGAVLDGATDDTTALQRVMTLSATRILTATIDGTLRISADKTIPTTLTLRFHDAGMISVDNTKTLTINGRIKADRQRIFTGAGTVVYGTPNSIRQSHVYPEWFGAVHDNATDDTAAIQKAIAMAKPAYGTVMFEVGQYSVAPAANAFNAESRVTYVGVNPAQTLLVFRPTANDCSLFTDSGSTDNVAFRNMGFQTAGANTGQRAFTISGNASSYTWDKCNFDDFDDWCLALASGQYHTVRHCRFSGTHNATDTGRAIQTSTFANAFVVENCRFGTNDRAIMVLTSGNAVTIRDCKFEANGSLATAKDCTVELNGVKGFVFSGHYIEANRTSGTAGVLVLNDCVGGTINGNSWNGDIGGTTYSEWFIYCNNGTMNVTAENNNFREILSGFVKAGTTYPIRLVNNSYYDGGAQKTKYSQISPLLSNPAMCDLDEPETFTFDPANIVDAANATTTVTMTGATLGDRVEVSAGVDRNGVTVTAYVSAANTITVLLQNEAGAARDLASSTWRVWRHPPLH